jgi:folylpolyglutamate synthase/dihydropteroate synthase
MLQILKTAEANSDTWSTIYFTASKILSTKDRSNDLTNVLDGQTSFQEVLRNKWVSLFDEEQREGLQERTKVVPTINTCLEQIQGNTGDEMTLVLVTGSLYLVGGFLEVLGFNTTI